MTLAITCTRQNIIKKFNCKNETELEKILRKGNKKWAHLVHKETGAIITSRYAINE